MTVLCHGEVKRVQWLRVTPTMAGTKKRLHSGWPTQHDERQYPSMNELTCTPYALARGGNWGEGEFRRLYRMIYPYMGSSSDLTA